MLIMIALSNCFLIIKKLIYYVFVFYCCEKIEYTGALNAKKAKEKWEAKRVAYDRVNKNLIFHSNILYIKIDKCQ